MIYANVAFPIAVNRLFTYNIPQNLMEIVKPGVRVLASFHGSKQEGVVVERIEETDLSADKIKPISDCLDEKPTYSDELLVLTKWIADYYLSSWGNALFCAVPAAVRNKKLQSVQLCPDYITPTGKIQKKIVTALETAGPLSLHQLAQKTDLSPSSLQTRIKTLRERGVIELIVTHKPKVNAKTTNVVALVVPTEDIEAEIEKLTSGADGYGRSTDDKGKRTPHAADLKHAKILQNLLNEGVPVAASDLTKRTKTNLSLLRTLERRGFINITRTAVVRNPISSQSVVPTHPHELNSAQLEAFTEIRNGLETEDRSGQTYLLHGVTGSGKTEIYMRVMAQILKSGKSVIILVPEISLTPQTASRFIGRFGERVAVLHSRLSVGERFDQWYRVHKGDAEIVIGPRSAVFAPVKNLGLLIIDEEHSDSYKSDTVPRYHAREVAKKRAEIANCPLILGSATPSLESYYHAKNGNYRLLNLPARVMDRKMPDVHTVDMRDELKNGNRSILSECLKFAIAERLLIQEQVILFLNRRGHSNYVFCRSCGYAEKCENCSISLTFHFESKKMVCHHCGHRRETHPTCPECESPAIDYFGRKGFGTESVEREIQKLFPDANVKRFDADSTAKKNSHEQILTAFEKQDIDILIGTQMIAKGLDFPNVTLVGVIVADTALNLPDFRASEHTFSLLTQVAGRSGRADTAGEVIIQTYMPDHYCISAVKKHDYIDFYEKEVEARNPLQYPPFSHMATLLLRGKNENEVADAVNIIDTHLDILQTGQFPEIKILGPAPAPLSKIDGKFRWHFLFRCTHVEKIAQLLQSVNDDVLPEIKSKTIECIMDIDPTNML